MPLRVHDISAVGLGASTNLPRFNMPLELGLVLGCKRYGAGAQHRKAGLVLDSDLYRYRTSISDIAGQDIRSHRADPDVAIKEIRNWLANASRRKGLPGGAEVVERYHRFQKELPGICLALKWQPSELTYADRREAIDIWLRRDR